MDSPCDFNWRKDHRIKVSPFASCELSKVIVPKQSGTRHQGEREKGKLVL